MPKPPKLAWRWVRDNTALLTLLLFFTTIGFVGTGVYLQESNCERADRLTGFELVSTVVYETGRVLTLNMDPRPHQTTGVRVGRVSAVLFVFFVGLQAVRLLLRDSWDNFRLMFLYRRGHRIVCGLGRVGWPIVDQLLAEGRRVVVLERDPANETAAARRAGAIVLQADATEEESLKRAHARRAREIYFVTGSDEENIEATIDLRKLIGARNQMTCFVHLVDPDLGDVLKETLQVPNSTVELHTFNVAGNSARQLIVEQLTPCRPTGRDEVALYVVIGSGPMARTVASHLAELAHFENQRRARLLLVADDPKAFADSILSRWGQFSPETVVDDWAKIDFPPDADDSGSRRLHPRPRFRVQDNRAIEYACNAVFAPRPGSMKDRDFVAALSDLLRKPGVKPVIIFCEEDDTANYSHAVVLERSLRTFHDVTGVPIFAWLPRQEPLKQLLADVKTSPIKPFGSCRDELKLAKLRDPIEDRLKLVIKVYFENEYGNPPHTIDMTRADGMAKARRVWKEQSEIDRHSNRMAAIHFQVKLACFGMKVVSAAEPGEPVPNPPPLDLLGEIEHNRWVAERLLSGVSYGPRSKTPPRRPQLCTTDAMKQQPGLEEEYKKDVSQIKGIWNELKKLKLKVVRV